MSTSTTPSSANESTKPIVLYRGWLEPGRYVWSPFVIKMEARLRFAGVPYETRQGSARSAPKGKVPYVELRDSNGEVSSTMGDSALILSHLVGEGILPDVNGSLDPSARLADLAIRALLEDKLYFYHSRERWLENYYTMRDYALSSIPYPLRLLVGNLVYRNVIKTLHGQGTGRYTDEEITAFKTQIWTTINDALTGVKSKSKSKSKSTEPFWVLGGNGPTEADVTVYAFIVSVLICRACPESQQIVRQFPVILEYADRIHDRYFPDYEKWD